MNRFDAGPSVRFSSSRARAAIIGLVGLLPLFACQKAESGPPRVRANHRAPDVLDLTVDDTGGVGIKWPERKPTRLPQSLSVQLSSLPRGTSVSLLGQTIPPNDPPLFGRTRSHEATLDGRPIVSTMVSAQWHAGRGVAGETVSCAYPVVVSVEGRGETSVDYSAYCNPLFTLLVTQFLEKQAWPEVPLAPAATGYLIIRQPWARRPEVADSVKKGETAWSSYGRATSISDVRFVVLADEEEAASQRCGTYRTSTGGLANVELLSTRTRVRLFDRTTGKEAAQQRVASRKGTCPEGGRLDEAHVAPPDLAAEQEWILSAIARIQGG